MKFVQATPDQFYKMLLRALPHNPIPETYLILAVLRQAIYDGIYGSSEARRFIATECCELYCGLLGLNYTFFREEIRKHAWPHFTAKVGLSRPKDRTKFTKKELRNGFKKREETTEEVSITPR